MYQIAMTPPIGSVELVRPSRVVDVQEITQRGLNIGTTWRTWHAPYPPLTFAFGARFARTSAIRVCQPAPLAFQAAMTLVATRIDSSLLGSASFGRPRRMSVSPLRRSASAIQRAVSSGA